MTWKKPCCEGRKPCCENIHAMADRPRAALGLAIAMAAFGATGCGTSSTHTVAGNATASATPSKPLATKAQFVAQAEDICRKLSSQEKPLKARQESLKGLPAASSDEAFVSLANQLVTLARTAVGQLRALPRPPGEAGKIKQLLTVYNEEATNVSNIAGEAAAAALKRSIATNSSLAQAFGMKDCIGGE
jgi:hypothetical protein